MTEDPKAAPLQEVAVTVHASTLVLEVRIGDKAVSIRLEPHKALELAAALLNAGLEHARTRAEFRKEAERIAESALVRAAH